MVRCAEQPTETERELELKRCLKQNYSSSHPLADGALRHWPHSCAHQQHWAQPAGQSPPAAEAPAIHGGSNHYPLSYQPHVLSVCHPGQLNCSPCMLCPSPPVPPCSTEECDRGADRQKEREIDTRRGSNRKIPCAGVSLVLLLRATAES